MIRQSVLISFPLGAKFNKNPKLVVYRQFLNMVRKLSCVNIEGKCYTCPMQKSCTYYKVSGENLRMYPASLFIRIYLKKVFFAREKNFNWIL